MTTYIAYARVSTDRQGRSGLGLEAQEATIRAFLKADDNLILPVMVEVESGRNNARPVLAEALAKCRLHGASLIVAKLDRLARDAAFVGTVLASGVSVVFCDVPASHGATGAFILGVMANVAQLEAGLTSERTKAALAAAKARGVKLGGYRGFVVDGAKGASKRREMANEFAARVAPMASGMRDRGMSLDAIAAELTAQGVITPNGGAWTATAVRRVLARA